ncbi:hypothetical protein MVEN_01837400 [Mycena venus]|uniref:Uncharacterized protein n=1 Tax=Mycena venus TaxID=2733690 RepID=A0A8H6XKU0_9AGAR|nr:hypothetical protein MVEN_01837400 [Mycena venus]
MKFLQSTALLSITLSVRFAQGKPCGSGGGECVTYFHGSDCDSANYIGDYVPTCGGNCFQYSSFDSLDVNGNDIFGTDCHVYSDSNCQNQIADTGNIVSFAGKCVNTQGAQSMKCYYGC